MIAIPKKSWNVKCVQRRFSLLQRAFTTDNKHANVEKPPPPPPIDDTSSAKKWQQNFIVSRFMRYLKFQERLIDRYLPGVATLYRSFKHGIKSYTSDAKECWHIRRKHAKSERLTLRELELYHKIPKDTVKLLPILIVFILPFGIYASLPLAYLFPRQLLCSHFWTIQQKSMFNMLDLSGRLGHNRLVFRDLQGSLDALKDDALYVDWAEILAMLGSGTHPSVEDILSCQRLFSSQPYAMTHLHRGHINHLTKMHGLQCKYLFPTRRLKKLASIILDMDRAITNEGGVDKIPPERIRYACYIRGLNPVNMKNSDIVVWLEKWLSLTKSIDPECASLILHAPILMAYNEPSNWRLIYGKK